ncbi:MAG: hypothetical protein JWM57_4045 [Phycisphaerales bacterium]|nr:hypothetical protein [Phycisphaerales bacterium]
MEDDPLIPFDDPALQAAVRRAAGAHHAHPALRAKVADIVTREQLSIRRNRHTMRDAFAVAAVLLVSGLVLYQALFRTSPASPVRGPVVSPNDRLFQQMADVQAGATEIQNLENVPTGQTAAELQAELARRLGRSTRVPDLAGKGWNITCAEVGELGSFKIGRVKYVNSGGMTASLLSLPASAISYADGCLGERYDTVIHGNVISSIRLDDSSLCVVGDAAVEPAVAQSLRDALVP